MNEYSLAKVQILILMLPMSHSKLRMSNAQGNEFFTLHSSFFV